MKPTIAQLPSNGSPQPSLVGSRLTSSNHYGSRELSHEVYTTGTQPIDIPEVDKHYVKRIAVTCGASGELEVRNFHKHLFDARNAELEEQCSRLSDEVEAEVAGADRHIKEVSSEMN